MKNPKSDTRREPKDGEISKLKSRIRRLNKDNSRLEQELKALRRQVNSQQEYINKHVKNISLEDVLKIDKKKNNSNNACVSCGSSDILISKLPFGTMVACRECNNVDIIKE